MRGQSAGELNNVLAKNMDFGDRQTLVQILPLFLNNCEIFQALEINTKNRQKNKKQKKTNPIFLQITFCLLEIKFYEFSLTW